ncbi:hypothetical protein CEP52_008923 [Fusarium oligoseptatum]|uniref:Actin-like protein ARP6 n=1 Tax=Fusarium oligoseptatum TaxID=2604345 RepID=A0A428TFK1_9HYPO|nr:hypothetical protein CEP52_008923 [Fusarium oligoseptatum]
MREDIQISTHDQTILRGWFYPTGTKAPVVVMSPGFSGIKDNFLPNFAERFQRAGFAVLLYDHRNWGDSDGLPRHHTNHYEQTQDAHDVIYYVTTRPDVDPERIAIWGSSFSGGIALIVGAIDPRVKAVVAQVPFVSGRSTREALPKSVITQIYNDRGETSNLDPTYMRIFPDSLEEAQNPANGTVLGTEECWRHLQVVKEMGHEKENKVTVQSLFHAIRAEPSAFVSQISPKPLFMTVCLQDSVIDPKVQLEVFSRAGEPKELLELDCGHFNAYRDGFFEENIAAQQTPPQNLNKASWREDEKAKPAPPKAPTTTLVLDNGADTIKAGLVRDGKIDEPRIIPNYIARDRARKVYVASEIEKCRDFGEIQFRRPVEKGFIVNWEAQKEIWDRELFENATTKIDPAETRLILAEPPNGLPILQTNCDQIVFEEYGFTSYYRGIGPSFNASHDIQSIFRTPQENPTVANTPAEAVMVIDSGYSHTTVTPILQGRPLQSAIKRLDVGGKVLTNYLTRLISLRHFDMRNDTYIVNEMKELSCYVSADFKADLEKSWKGTRGDRRPDYLTGGGLAKDYILPDFHTRSKGILCDYEPSRHSKARKAAAQSEEDALTLRNERFTVPELLFSPSDAGIRQPGVADLVQESLNELPIGLWPSLLANIIVVGGNTHLDGFIQRLQKEVVQLVPDDCIVRVARPADPITNTWYGGANLANHPHINKLAVTKKEYEEHGAAWVARKFATGLGT